MNIPAYFSATFTKGSNVFDFVGFEQEIGFSLKKRISLGGAVTFPQEFTPFKEGG